MATKSKRTLAIRAMVDRNNRYAIEEALELVKKMATTKFDESVDVAVGLGIDPRKSD
ncbi:50S ribosomal protein L1, partial [Acidithiobacillus ferridurans]|nr:50S ribosomal protein L1 [Acidithiobacillus ferridurans]MBU2814340.1 50S ribosomal protein L1 [Acidithiobacillus ferruginosus]